MQCLDEIPYIGFQRKTRAHLIFNRSENRLLCPRRSAGAVVKASTEDLQEKGPVLPPEIPAHAKAKFGPLLNPRLHLALVG
eukprot:1151338-Pelagomonas_calceolata.AAC.2